ncbi:TfoX/Sxy family protein [Candidatus Neptunochlamydia vexilliferae]|nr:TfoX/Sxy family protein [Candidatus Neptunochlamydia vexilliferae]
MGKWKKSPQDLIDRFYETLEAFEAAEMRKMFGYPCSFVNGNMFTGLHEENWVLRLPEGAREEITKLGAEPFIPMGRPMKQYVMIPPAIQQDQEALQGWISRSLAFVSSLPKKEPKQKTKKK